MVYVWRCFLVAADKRARQSPRRALGPGGGQWPVANRRSLSGAELNDKGAEFEQERTYFPKLTRLINFTTALVRGIEAYTRMLQLRLGITSAEDIMAHTIILSVYCF